MFRISIFSSIRNVSNAGDTQATLCDAALWKFCITLKVFRLANLILNLSLKTFLITETEDLWELDFAASHARTCSAHSRYEMLLKDYLKEIAPDSLDWNDAKK